MIDTVAAWLQAATWILGVAGLVIGAALWIALGLAAWQLLRLARWTASRARHRWDRHLMGRKPALLLDRSDQAITDYLTIRRTWQQPTREEVKR